jgi:hypothetical protein
MRRGLLKDLANTPTQIVCGYRLYGPDLARLSEMAGSVVTIDLLRGTTALDGVETVLDLDIVDDTTAWIQERIVRDGVPAGTIRAATLTLSPRRGAQGLLVDCHTTLESAETTYESRDTARWHQSDIDDIARG